LLEQLHDERFLGVSHRARILTQLCGPAIQILKHANLGYASIP
jgi:hypothetical protein